MPPLRVWVVPLNVPDDFTLLFCGSQDCLDAVLRQLTQELQFAAIAGKAIEQESSLCNGKGERARFGYFAWRIPH